MQKSTPAPVINDYLPLSYIIYSSIIFLIKYHRFLSIFFLNILKYRQPLRSILSLHFFSITFVLHLFILNSLQPIIIMPNRHMIIWFQMHRFRLFHIYCSTHKLSLIIIINSRRRIFYLIELDKRKPSLFLGHMIDRYLNRFDLPKSVEKSE